MSGHVRSGGSVLARRLGCPASLYAETVAGYVEKTPDPESQAAALGTKLHEVFERALLDDTDARPPDSDTDVACVQAALDHVRDIVPPDRRGEILVEAAVDFRRWVPDPMGARGMLDAGWFDTSSRTLYVWDLKTGRVPVSALANPQLRAYALGLLDGVGYLYDVDTVELTVLQHVIGNVSVERISAKGLETWGEYTLRPAVNVALDPKRREYVPNEANCRYCSARLRCRARASIRDALVADARGVVKDGLLTDEEVRQMYGRVRHIQKWADAFMSAAHDRFVAGDIELPEGFELATKNTRRKWKDGVEPVDVAQQLGAPHLAAVTTTKLLPLGELESQYGKDALIGLWEKPEGSKTVVPASGRAEMAEGFTFGDNLET